MENSLIPTLLVFMRKEKIDLSITVITPSEFWLQDTSESITVRFKVNVPKNEILYNVSSPEFSVHFKEVTIKDIERLVFLAEEKRQWGIAKIIEDIWLILDKVKLWVEKNNFSIT